MLVLDARINKIKSIDLSFNTKLVYLCLNTNRLKDINLKDNQKINDSYFDMVISRIEKQIGVSFRDNIVLRRDYATSDFIKDYNSFKGNAYGLANTLSQTAILKPTLINKKVKNLFYTGQLTVPGPGVPPCLISGKLVAEQVLKYLNKN